MAQKSMAWFTDGFDGAVGDGATPYTQEEWRAKEYTFFGDGVDPNDGGQLEVTGVASPLSMATGRAQVAGFHYWNDAALNLTVATPTTGTTGGRIVLRAEWAGASEATVRAAVLLSADGTAGLPALTQTVLTTYEIGIASFTITTGGVITVTDTRVTRPLIGELVDDAVTTSKIVDEAVTAAKAGAGLPVLTRRRGGSATVWATAGTTNYTPANILEQVGVASIPEFNGYESSVTVDLPIAYDELPFVQVSLIAVPSIPDGDTAVIWAVPASGSQINLFIRVTTPAVLAAGFIFAWRTLGALP
jgi:hypothetical protein